MSSLLLVLVVLISITYSAQKSIYLDTSNPSINGAAVTILKDTTANSYGWYVHATDDNGFHIKLTLNDTWIFDSTRTTIIKIQIGSNSPIGKIDGIDRDLLVSFSQSDNIYFTTILQIDEEFDHEIYPQCDSSIPYTQSYASGNVESKALEPCCPSDRERKVMSSFYDLNPHTDPPNVAYPLTFILENNQLSNYMLYTYTNPGISARSCGFVKMAADTPIDMFIASEEPGESFNISYINITHTILDTSLTSQPITSQPITSQPITNSPVTLPPVTIQPSNQPTSLQPTSLQPSKYPSKQPTTLQPTSSQPTTLQPTSIPSNYPSTFPSEYPSSQPTTVNPTSTIPTTFEPTTTYPVTSQPSNFPSNYPTTSTNVPTITTKISTNPPSFSSNPTITPMMNVINTTHSNDHQVTESHSTLINTKYIHDTNTNARSLSFIEKYYLYIAAFIGLLLLLCFIEMIYCCYKWKKQKDCDNKKSLSSHIENTNLQMIMTKSTSDENKETITNNTPQKHNKLDYYMHSSNSALTSTMTPHSANVITKGACAVDDVFNASNDKEIIADDDHDIMNGVITKGKKNTFYDAENDDEIIDGDGNKTQNVYIINGKGDTDTYISNINKSVDGDTDSTDINTRGMVGDYQDEDMDDDIVHEMVKWTPQ